MVGVVNRPGDAALEVHYNAIAEAAVEFVSAHEADTLRTILRHARIPHERAAEFWDRVEALTREFVQLPRSSDVVYGFAAGLYPTDHPHCPNRTTTKRTPERGRVHRHEGLGPLRRARSQPQ